jgi:uncharacterized phage protein (TIGR01671 family)
MRKYRGMTKEGEWVYGYYFVQNEKHYIYQDLAYIDKRVLHWSVEVLPGTVGQSTGLTDKGSKEIFAGDIVRITRCDNGEQEIAFVEWSPKDCSVCYSVGERRYVYRVNTNMEPEIIGNIHQNPELMEAEDGSD